MAHPRDRLRPGERIILDTRPHWWYFARPTGLLVGAIVVSVLVVWSTRDLGSNDDRIVDNAGISTPEALEALDTFGGADLGTTTNLAGLITLLASVLIIVAAVILGISVASWYFTHFFVSSDRVVNRSGILNRQGVEIPIERVNTVFFEQNFVERLVGAGDVLVESAGESGVQRFFDIANPLAVKERIRGVLEEAKDAQRPQAQPVPAPAPAPIAAPTTERSISDKLVDLNELKNQGVISEDEFTAKKTELLSRI